VIISADFLFGGSVYLFGAVY